MTIINLVDKTDDARNWSVRELIAEASQNEELLSCRRAIILYLADDSDDFLPRYQQAGMKRSETIALLESVKHLFLNGLFDGGAF